MIKFLEIHLNFIRFSLAQATKLIFAIAIFISYALQCYVPVQIIWDNYIDEKYRNSEKSGLYQLGLRIGLTLFTCKLNFIDFKFELIHLFLYSCVCGWNSTPRTLHLTVWRILLEYFGTRISRYHGVVCALARRIGKIQLHFVQRHIFDIYWTHWTSVRNLYIRQRYHY